MRENEEVGYISEKERRKTNRNAVISVLLAAVVIFTFFAGYFIRGITEPAFGQKINEIMGILNEVSVYFDDDNGDDLARVILEPLKAYDPYISYYSPEEYKRLLSEDGGNYSGVGVGFFSDYSVGKVYMNSSAYKAGVKVGDRIIAGVYKGDETASDGNEKFTDFSEKLAQENEGKADKDKKTMFDIYGEFFAGFDISEEFKVKIKRGETEFPVTLKKENYVVSYVEYFDNEKYFYFSTEENDNGVKEFGGRERNLTEEEKAIHGSLADDTAYIRLYEFEGGAAEQFADALDYMTKTRNKTKLILDLRDNGGGQIDILLKIAACIINDNGKSSISILKTKEKVASTHSETSENKFYSDITDIAVIANTGTASASECLIGALNDYGDAETYKGANFNLDRLILTEEHESRERYCTYGKGIMQTTYSLRSGGAFKLTTAYIYWPLSVDDENNPICIQDIGITTSVSENCVSDEAAIMRANEVLHFVPTANEE